MLLVPSDGESDHQHHLPFRANLRYLCHSRGTSTPLSVAALALPALEVCLTIRLPLHQQTMVPLCGFMNSIIYFWSNICYRLSSSSDDDEQSSVSRSSEGTESNGSHHFSPTTRDGRSSLTYSPTAASPPCRESNSAFYSVSSVPWSIRSSRRSSLGLMEPRAEAQKRAKDQLPAPHRRKSSLKQERGHSLHSTSRSLPLAELTVSSEEMTDSLRHVRI